MKRVTKLKIYFHKIYANIVIKGNNTRNIKDINYQNLEKKIEKELKFCNDDVID